jgi:hypothetical protein
MGSRQFNDIQVCGGIITANSDVRPIVDDYRDRGVAALVCPVLSARVATDRDDATILIIRPQTKQPCLNTITLWCALMPLTNMLTQSFTNRNVNGRGL